MTFYEALLIFHPQTAEEKQESLLKRFEDKITQAGGERIRVDKWGRKRLAYSFEKAKIKEGIYVLISFHGVGETVKVLTETFRITEEVVRHAITKGAEKKEAEEVAAAFPKDVVPAETKVAETETKEEKVGESK